MTRAESSDNKSRIIYGPSSCLPIVYHYKTVGVGGGCLQKSTQLEWLHTGAIFHRENAFHPQVIKPNRAYCWAEVETVSSNGSNRLFSTSGGGVGGVSGHPFVMHEGMSDATVAWLGILVHQHLIRLAMKYALWKKKKLTVWLHQRERIV